jgi:hypothetical protein
MDTYEGIIRDEETDAGKGIELDSNWDAGINSPCHGETCHEECDCWKSFRLAVREQLWKQKESMREVSECCKAGLSSAGVLWESSCIECGKYEPDTIWV